MSDDVKAMEDAVAAAHAKAAQELTPPPPLGWWHPTETSPMLVNSFEQEWEARHALGDWQAPYPLALLEEFLNISTTNTNETKDKNHD